MPDVNIFGYADFLHFDAYNMQLSQKRAVAVKSYILQHIPEKKISVLQCKGLGEKESHDNGMATGEPEQRRVDIVVVNQPQQQVQKLPEQTSVAADDTRKKEIRKKNAAEHVEKRIVDLKQGESLTIEGLNFIPGRHVLVKSAIPVLEQLLETLKAHPNLKIEVQGHICCMDNSADGMDFDTQEMKLSENRAKAIYNYLIRNGVDEERLTYKGYGHSKPKVAPERNAEDEQRNRRVEIKVLEN